MTRDLLDRLSAAIDGLCPCGAPPRPGSAYCSYDCEPTHRSDDTDTSGPGEYGAQSTAMRWRPDLVTAYDDSGLELVFANIPRGPYNGTMYRRVDTDVIHLRLDDGHRWVGCDVDGGDDSPPRVMAAWQRLERELGNQRHLERSPFPGPTSDELDRRQAEVDQQRAARHARDERRICDWLRANNLDPNVIPVASAIRIHDRQITVNVWTRNDNGGLLIVDGEPVTQPHTVPLVEPWPAGLYYGNLRITRSHPEWVLSPGAQQQIAVTLQRAGASINTAIRDLYVNAEPLRERMRYFVDAVHELQPEPADHPLARIVAQRRTQPHGPQARQRPPRQLGP